MQRLNQKIKEQECEIYNLKSKGNILQREADHKDQHQRQYVQNGYAKHNNLNDL